MLHKTGVLRGRKEASPPPASVSSCVNRGSRPRPHVVVAWDSAKGRRQSRGRAPHAGPSQAPWPRLCGVRASQPSSYRQLSSVSLPRGRHCAGPGVAQDARVVTRRPWPPSGSQLCCALYARSLILTVASRSRRFTARRGGRERQVDAIQPRSSGKAAWRSTLCSEESGLEPTCLGQQQTPEAGLLGS